jgi:hypothetical protein
LEIVWEEAIEHSFMLWLSNLSGGNEEIHEICSQGGPAEILYEDSPENKLGNFTTQTKLLGEA